MRRRVEKKVTRALGLLLIIFTIGVVAFKYLEKWSWVDSFYFVGVTVTTIGYGDIHPVTPLGRVFTVFFALVSVSITLYAFAVTAERFMRRELQLFIDVPKKKFEEHFGKFTQAVNFKMNGKKALNFGITKEYLLNNKTFKVVKNDGIENFLPGTMFHFKQEGTLVKGEYSGGKAITGKCEGELKGDTVIYHYLHSDGEGKTITGNMNAQILIIKDGKMQLLAEWQCETPDQKGSCILEEL